MMVNWTTRMGYITAAVEAFGVNGKQDSRGRARKRADSGARRSVLKMGVVGE